MNVDSEKYKELKKLSRLARITGIANFFVGTGVIAMIIFFGSEKGMDIFSLLVALMVGYSWYKGANLIFMSKEMLAFASVEEYMKHVEDESRKDSDI